MTKHKKDLKQRMSEFVYNKPVMDKRFLELKKNLGEISSMLDEKKKK